MGRGGKLPTGISHRGTGAQSVNRGARGGPPSSAGETKGSEGNEENQTEISRGGAGLAERRISWSAAARTFSAYSRFRLGKKPLRTRSIKSPTLDGQKGFRRALGWRQKTDGFRMGIDDAVGLACSYLDSSTSISAAFWT